MPAVRPDWAGQFIAGGVRAARPMGRTGGPGRRRDSGGGMQWLPIGGMPARRGDGPGGNGAAGTVPGITAPGTVPPSMVPPDIVPPIGGTILGGTVLGGTVSAGAVPARHRHGFAPARHGAADRRHGIAGRAGGGAAADGRHGIGRRAGGPLSAGPIGPAVDVPPGRSPRRVRCCLSAARYVVPPGMAPPEWCRQSAARFPAARCTAAGFGGGNGAAPLGGTVYRRAIARRRKRGGVART